MPDVFVLTEQDRNLIQEFLREQRNLRINHQGKPAVGRDWMYAPETYIAVPPEGGIPAVTIEEGEGEDPDITISGSATCEIHRLLENGTFQYNGFKHRIYNLGAAVPEGVKTVVTRDKYGKWWVVDHPSEGGGAADTCPAYGLVTLTSTPTALNNWNPSAEDVWHVWPVNGVTYSISGIEAPVSGCREITIINTSPASTADAGKLKFLHQNTSSLTANRLNMPESAEFTLTARRAIRIRYDDDGKKWRPLYGWPGLEVAASALATTFPGITRLQFPTTPGFTLTHSPNGVITVGINEAAQLQTGVITGNAQTIGGKKSFLNAITVYEGSTSPGAFGTVYFGANIANTNYPYIRGMFGNTTSGNTEITISATGLGGGSGGSVPPGKFTKFNMNGGGSFTFSVDSGGGSPTYTIPNIRISHPTEFGGFRTGQTGTHAGLVFTAGWLTGGSFSLGGASGSFTTTDGKTVTVVDGKITSIV